ncbi:MAG: hypothetical protein MI863_14695 [Desulfobacterales bacterium]|nr:hypothetical protein [Desulfobacterales bacterium]
MNRKQHGEHRYERRGNVLVVKASGPWNSEADERFADTSKEYIRKWFPGTEWAMLVHLNGQGIYTPESMCLLKNLHTWRIENGLRRIAVIHSRDSAQTQTLTEYQFDNIYSSGKSKKCRIKYFHNLKEAETWLKDSGYLRNENL